MNKAVFPRLEFSGENCSHLEVYKRELVEKFRGPRNSAESS